MYLDIEGDLVKGTFIKRVNRFIAHIMIDDKLQVAHVPNTGRMKEFLVEGARVIARRVNNPKRKTNWDLLLVYEEDTLIAIDSKWPNYLLYKGFKDHELDYFKGYEEVYKEITYGNSRFDIGLTGKENVLIEAKCATFVKDGLARFPDAPTERGQKHIKELIHATSKGIQTGVFFIIQRPDAKVFEPNWEMDPLFSEALKTAYHKGVLVKALVCDVTPKHMKIKGEVPVVF